MSGIIGKKLGEDALTSISFLKDFDVRISTGLPEEDVFHGGKEIWISRSQNIIPSALKVEYSLLTRKFS